MVHCSSKDLEPCSAWTFFLAGRPIFTQSSINSLFIFYKNNMTQENFVKLKIVHYLIYSCICIMLSLRIWPKMVRSGPSYYLIIGPKCDWSLELQSNCKSLISSNFRAQNKYGTCPISLQLVTYSFFTVAQCKYAYILWK